jgi:hypothetical protein
MTAFEFEAMQSRNWLDAGVPFLAVVQADELLLLAPADHLCPRCRRRPRLVGEKACGYCRERFSNEGADPYAEGQER